MSQDIQKSAERAVADLLKAHELRWRYDGIREAGMNAAKIAHRISPEAAKAICAVFAKYQMGEFMWTEPYGDGTTPPWLDEPIKL